ncbi:hypothetical protein M0805_001463 [Coniferiporia weirii]|nr:hypothetical protein M0805_001463 [Coniferiporia weirii]
MNSTFSSEVDHLIVAKRYATACWALAIYEYMITFDREVQSIWQRKYTFVTVLWFFNRYTLLLSYCPIILAFYLPYTAEFPGVIQIVSNISTGLTLSLRVYALYGRALWIFLILAPCLIAEITVEGWAVASGVPVPIPQGQAGCILTGEQNQGDRFAALWIGQLAFPTMIFALTVVRVFVLRRQGIARDSISVFILRDGAIYFLVIFLVNLANVLTYVIAPPDIQAINASLSALITTVMICRLMLNLRRAAEWDSVRTHLYQDFSEVLIGDLGEELDINDIDKVDQFRSERESAWKKELNYESGKIYTTGGIPL